LAVYGHKRLKRYPGVPTLEELGLDIADDAPWGLATPKAVPPERIRILHDAARKALDDADFLASLDTFANEVRYLRTEQYESYMATRIYVEREVVEKYNLWPR
jgi:tripartite-type tricarboxylate transporter receptor subunit TctC